ncbi:glycosyltransferase [Sharpea azabuensis]|uniref:glycosyltransferase n=1 Tax=Sharpea azabuensis TaxID=322505 RepID=UPI001932A043
MKNILWNDWRNVYKEGINAIYGHKGIINSILKDSDVKISFIVAVFNIEVFVSECIESLIHQTYKNIEIILIDDGSTDNSGKICNQYASKDSRVRTIHQKNMGLSEARNTGCVMLQVII